MALRTIPVIIFAISGATAASFYAPPRHYQRSSSTSLGAFPLARERRIADSNAEKSPALPFVVEAIGRATSKEVQEVTKVCVDVFFNDDVPRDSSGNKIVRPWKAMQLAQLRNSQYSDIRSRAFMSSKKMDMFVARRVFPASSSSDDETCRLKDVRNIFNAEHLSDTDYVAKGEILGYCEVSEKKFGLGGIFDQTLNSSGSSEVNGGGGKLRPVLTNLSVKEEARRSGVGSRLLDACERAVQQWEPKYNEIILQVEEDNKSAKRFYEKRGYKVVFADPACRRYDTTGLFLKSVRTTKIAMRKQLNSSRAKATKETSDDFFGLDVFRKLRNAVLSESDSSYCRGG